VAEVRHEHDALDRASGPAVPGGRRDPKLLAVTDMRALDRAAPAQRPAQQVGAGRACRPRHPEEIGDRGQQLIGRPALRQTAQGARQILTAQARQARQRRRGDPVGERDGVQPEIGQCHNRSARPGPRG